jgi:hypothetical protein
MCGPDSAENQDLTQQNSLTNTIQQAFNGRFASQSQINSLLTNALTPIAQAGPDQQGFGPQELAALNTSVGEGVGQNYAKATQALNNNLAARGGGNEMLPTGSQAALKGSLAASAANQLSSEQSQITQANYATGRQNFQSATAGLNALSAEMNPGQFSGQAIQSNEGAFGMASQINQQQNQKWADIAGGVEALGGMAAGGIGNLDFTGSSNPGEQIGNFFGGI